MADTDIIVSEMTPASQINTTDLMIMTQPDAQAETGYTTKSGTVLQVANKMLKGTEYSTDLPDFTDKTPLGGLEELKADIKALLPISSASGNPCTFETNLADALVSLKASIVARGGGGTPSTPIPIVGISSLDITRCGKNWLSNDNSKWGLYGTTSSGYTPNSQRLSPIDFNIPFVKGETFTISIIDNTNSGKSFYVGVGQYANGTRIVDSGWKGQPYTFTIDEQTDTVRISLRTTDSDEMASFLSALGTTFFVQINLGSSALPYAPYNGQTFTIDLDGTRYGGYVDAVRGKLVVTHGYVDLGTCVWGGGSEVSGKNLFTVAISDIKRPATTATVPNWKLEGYELKSQVDAPNYNNVYSGLSWFDGIAFWTTDYTAAQREQLKSDMVGYHIAYELATPIEIDVSAISVEAVSGVNNIVSNGGGDIEVEYRDSIQHYIDSKIASVQALIL